MQTLKRSDLPLKQLPSGDQLTLTSFELQGAKGPGPKVYIQASVHGAELQGNAVIYQLMDYLLQHPFKGSVQFVPCANPYGMNQKIGTYTLGRFSPNSGDNWNRLYVDLMKQECEHSGFDLTSFAKTHEHTDWPKLKLAFKAYLAECLKRYEAHVHSYGAKENGALNILLQQKSSDADIVLDLHTGPTATRYLYTAEYAREKARDLNFPHTLVIPNEFGGAMDEANFMPWYGLQQALAGLGRTTPLDFEAYTVELGSEELIDLTAAQDDALRILHYLNRRGLELEALPALAATEQYACLLKNYRSYYATQAGLVEYIKQPGDHFKAGELLARTLNFKQLGQSTDSTQLKQALGPLYAQAAGIVINHCPSSAVAQGMVLFQVMEQVEKL